MHPWQSSIAYRLWVIGGLLGIVAFAVIGGLSDPADQDFILYLIPVIAVWVAGLLAMQWRGVNRDPATAPGSPGAGRELSRWSIGLGAVLCLAIFAGVFAFYAGVDETLYPLGESGPGMPIVLIPAVGVALVGAGRAMGILRTLQRGGSPAGSDRIEGPTDVAGPEGR